MRLIKLAIQKLTQTRPAAAQKAEVILPEVLKPIAVSSESLSSQAITNTRLAEVAIQKADKGGVKYLPLKLSDFTEIQRDGGMSKGELGSFLERLLNEKRTTFISASSIKDVSKTRNNENSQRFFRSINAKGEFGGVQNSVIKISTNESGTVYTRFFNYKTGELLSEKVLYRGADGRKSIRLNEREILQVEHNADGTHSYEKYKDYNLVDTFKSKK